MFMRFSIVVPVYNVDDYLSVCVDSLLAQTHSDFQVILVDDGSTDRIGVICDACCSRNPERICVLHQENQGQFMARMNGIRYADGDVLMFVDSDDCLRIDALELLDRKFLETDCDMVIFNASFEPDYQRSFCQFPFSDGQIFQKVSKKEVYRQLVCDSNFNSVCLKAVKRSVLKDTEVSMRFAFVGNGEDLLLSAHLITHAQKILFLDQNLYYYRQRSGSVVHTFNPNRAVSIRTVHMRMEQYIEQWGYPELKAPHHSREVRGWLETLVLLHRNRSSLTRAEYRVELRRMAEDPYFRNAYENMDAAVLGKSRRICAKLLYENQFRLLGILLSVRDILKNNT